MARIVINRIKEYADLRKLSGYRLIKDTGLTPTTLYRYYNDPKEIPSGKVLQKLANAYPETEPNDWLSFIEEAEVES